MISIKRLLIGSTMAAVHVFLAGAAISLLQPVPAALSEVSVQEKEVLEAVEKVAPTVEEIAKARDLAINGIMGRCWREFLLPIYLGLGLGRFLKRDPSMPDEAVDLEYLADNLWFVGSPQTVADRIIDLKAQTGGFGHLTMISYDATNEREAWDRSLRLLMNDVWPQCQDTGAAPRYHARG